MDGYDLAKCIEHTNLRPFATCADIEKLCNEAKENEFYGICVNPCWVGHAQKFLGHSDVKITTVIGFPLGSTSTESKVAETRKALLDGADEFDMVVNIGCLKSKKFDVVKNDICAIRNTCGEKILKLILECCYLTDSEKDEACRMAVKAGADFVKTSTGFGPGGATEKDVILMKKAIEGTRVKIKASGGINTYEDAVKMIRAGASRIGTSSSIEILKGARMRL
ncbi:MAG: deoxyribose-phosphate aldolase [Candidatus Thermoplasmatota archaeon]|nr:deoxyribose-phosphate aldolase [Candidatus Thermoplasmatota archaeon]